MALAARRWRRQAVRAAPWVVAAPAAAAVVSGRLALASFGVLEALVLVALLSSLAALGYRAIKAGAVGRPVSPREEAEVGALLVLAGFVVARPDGSAGLDGPLFPVVYLVMAFLVAFLSRPVGLGLTALAVVLDVASFAWAGQLGERFGTVIAHAGFLAIFAVLYRAVLAAQVASGRARESLAIRERQREVEDRAREYRLVAGEGSAAADEGKWVTAAVQEVEEAVGNALEVAACALKPHTVAVYLLREDDRALRLQDCRTPADDILRDLDAREGLLGAAVKRARPMRLHGELKGVTWYGAPRAVGALLVVPLLDRRGAARAGRDDAFLRGLVIADRLEAAPFTDDDERLLLATGREVLRAIEIERVMRYIRTARDEKETFFRAIEELNRVSKPAEVFASALESVRLAVPALDFRALTTCEEVEEGKYRHRVEGVVGVAAAKALEGREFGDNPGLVSSAVRYGAALPGREGRQQVFDEGTEIRGLGSLRVVPLAAGGRTLGTLVCGSRRRGVLGADAVRSLEVIAGQAAQAILRARLFEQTERMATTDGLTGLVNHRNFQLRFDDELARAARAGRPLAVVLADIDHFKAVNDTYGHATGDAVLRGVAKILQGCARSTDVVARYGGEEFALLLPETDMAGGKQIAERIRTLMEAHRFETELGPLGCTLSLGIAGWPDAAATKAALFEAADACLYHCKRMGRNRSVTVAEMSYEARLKAAGEG
jgi:diguanylate cyclase (GGDEF)-like protein